MKKQPTLKATLRKIDARAKRARVTARQAKRLGVRVPSLLINPLDERLYRVALLVTYETTTDLHQVHADAQAAVDAGFSSTGHGATAWSVDSVRPEKR